MNFFTLFTHYSPLKTVVLDMPMLFCWGFFRGLFVGFSFDPCSYGNIIVRATHFCKTCEDPEPLCESCAAQHGRHKISRHHKICENIGEFPKEHTNTE